MEKFIDKTNSGKEPAVKVGNAVPQDAVNVAWFSSKDINPANNLKFVDLSSLTPENVNLDESFSKVMYANELGILEDKFGNSFIDSDDIYVSDLFLNGETLDSSYSVDQLESTHFASSYYVSNFFTLMRTVTHFDVNISSYLNNNYVPKNIKVLDQDGNHYADQETGRLKYRISLESFVTEENINFSEIPHKIIVLLEDPNPKNLVLVYDKVESDSTGAWSNLHLGYSETINSVPIFKKVQEETEVLDPSNLNEKSYSVKRNVSLGGYDLSVNTQQQNQIFVNRKALDDNRVFEVFNWRVVAKLNSSVSFSEINYGKEIVAFNSSTRSVRAAVLYSSSQCSTNNILSSQFDQDAAKIKPYVFYNLQRSPFNLSGLNFVNPISTAVGENSRSYWLVDIDTVTDEQIKLFDSLALNLYWKLDDRQAAKLRSFINSSGVLIIDAAAAPNDALLKLDSRLSTESRVSAQAPTTAPFDYADSIQDSIGYMLLASSINNSFDINEDEFTEDCGIFGYAKNVNNQYKRYKNFTDENLPSILKQENKSIFVHIRNQKTTDSLISTNIVASATDFLSYCNDIYGGTEIVSQTNNSNVAVPVFQNSFFSRFVEGPYKFLYNCVTTGLNDKSESTRVRQDIKSSVHFFSGKWRSDWVIDENVLFEDETMNLFVSDVVDSISRKVRPIVSNVKNFYLEEVKNVFSWFKDVFLDSNEFNVDFFIEFTNSNVKWTNSTQPSADEIAQVSSSYNIVKVVNKTGSCAAYTDKKSPTFTIPSGFGAYVIKEKIVPSKDLELEAKNTAPIKNYPFNFNVSHSYLSTSESSQKLDIKFQFKANVKFTQTQNFSRPIENIITIPGVRTVIPGSEALIGPGAFTTTQSPDPRLKNISSFFQSFAYTYDIDEGNHWDEYSVGDSGTYVKYIQLTLDAAGFKTPITNQFTSATQSAVRKFQESRKIKVDGIVDSQTKQSLARVWKRMSLIQPVRYQRYIDAINKGNYGDRKIDAYIRASIKTTDADVALSRGEVVRLINFSGIKSKKDPKEIQMWVQFEFPSIYYTPVVGVPDPNTNIDKVLGIIVEAPDFSSKASGYRGIKLLDYNLFNSTKRSNRNLSTGYKKNDSIYIDLSGQNYKADDFKNPTAPQPSTPIPEEDNGESDDFRNLPSISGQKGVSILLQGSNLRGSFGNTAEGMAIGRVYFKVRYKDTIVTTPDTVQRTYTENIVEENRLVNGIVNGEFTVKNVGLDDVVTLISNPSFILKNCTLSSMEYYEVKGNNYTDKLISYSVPEGFVVSLDNTSFSPTSAITIDIPEKINLSAIDANSIVLNEESFQITSVKASGDQSSKTSYDDSYVEFNLNSTSVTLASNALKYSAGDVYKQSESLSSYFLRSVDGTILIPGKNTINYYDQVMLLCKQDGSPIGINLSGISTAVSTDKDIYYSNIEVLNTLVEQPGFLYGFYDIVSRTFLGKTITYEKYISVGPQNVFIGLYAFDYDGNLETLKEFTEINSGDTYVPASVPAKMAFPVYSIKYIPRNKIQLKKTPDLLEKTEPWPLFVSSGSFMKKMEVLNTFSISNIWSSFFSGQTIIAKYDTSSINSVASSKIFGKGYLDIIDEVPIVNSPYSISLKMPGLHRVHKPSNDLQKFASIIKPIVKVFTRETEESAWVQIDDDKIRNINCEESRIEFKEPVISYDENLTKVSYTVKTNSVIIKNSNGVPIPLNPFLNKDTVKLNKPLYIYLYPTEIYKKEDIFTAASSDGFWERNINSFASAYVQVDAYNPDSIINFTYNNNIFNKLDTYEYDPLALLIGIVYVTNTNVDENFSLTDLRVKGGGVSANFDTNRVISDIENAVSYWDVYPPMGEAYPKGGYAIVRIPTSVKGNFVDPNEVRNVVRRNITAGVVFELQDMEGNDWSTNA